MNAGVIAAEHNISHWYKLIRTVKKDLNIFEICLEIDVYENTYFIGSAN